MRRGPKTRHYTMPRTLAARAMRHRRIPYRMVQAPDQPNEGPEFVLFGPCPAVVLPEIKPDPSNRMVSHGIISPPDTIDAVPVSWRTDSTVDAECPWCHAVTHVTDGELVDWLNLSTGSRKVKPATKENA